jgi:iron complex outermembrane receptor protein
VRGAFQTARHDGYQRAVAPPGFTDRAVAVGNDRYDQDDVSGRVQALYTPSDMFSWRLSADYLHQGGAGGGDVAYNTATPSLFPGPFQAFSDENIFRDNTFWSTATELNWDFGLATVTYMGAYNVSSLDRMAENAANHNPSWFIGEDKTWSHELRFSSESERLKWVGGLYYFTEDNDVDFRIFLTSTNFLSFIQPQVNAKSKAAFGQATFSATDALRLTAGARYNQDKKSRNGGTYFTNPAGAITGTVTLNKADKSWTHFDWKLGLDYDLTDSSMLYATTSTGYKAGGYFDGDNTVADNTYKP